MPANQQSVTEPDFLHSEYGVSVLMPVHNGGGYLNAAVTSILQQAAVMLELVIIDDHSTDQALNSIPHDPRVKIVQSPGKGIVPALNTGIRESRFPFIARMDADDIAAKNRLRLQLTHFHEHPEVDVCGTKVKIFNDAAKVAEGYRQYEEWINGLCEPNQIETEFFVESCIPHPSAMLRRKLLQSLGGYHDSAWPEDYDLWCRALLLGSVFGKPRDSELLFWRDHSDRLSRLDQRYSKQMFLQCKAYYLSRYLRQQGVNRCHIWGTGPTGLKLHDYLGENEMQVNGFIDINPQMLDRRKRGKSVHIAADQPAKLASSFKSIADSIIVVAVSARGARQQIRDYLEAAGLIESEDFLFAA